ncbi:MAG: hypothetical protein ACFFCS_23560 [Candidatus Hodarchaeota archaeon]
MRLSAKSIQSLMNRSESDIWPLVTALQQLQNAIFQLEKNESDPDILKDLATRAGEIGKELEEILAILEEKIED